MIESPQLDTNEFDGLQNEQTWFNFESTLSETQDSENTPLPEWFKRYFDWSIVCKTSINIEDYNKKPSPIEKVVGANMKEWEYWWIDYSGCKPAERPYESQSFLFLKKINWNIVIEGENLEWQISNTVYLPQRTKIIPFDFWDEYMRFLWHEETNDLNKKYELIKTLKNLCINFADIKTFFWEDKTEFEIFNVLKNTNLEDTIDEQRKKQIFWECSNMVESLDILSWIQYMSLKKKLWNTLFYKYVWNFISLMEQDNTSIKKLNKYLSSSCRMVTEKNLDEYLDYVVKWWKVNLYNYTLDEAKTLQEFWYNIDIATLYNINITDWKDNGITKNMCDFCSKSKFVIEDVFINEKEWKNLFKFLSIYPQKLQNLWWIEIKEINLNTDEWWYNFCFRWILEMIKSRWNIDILPYPWENANENELNEWKESREEIIKEYERLLRIYIWLDFYTNEQWKQEQIDKKSTFDRIYYSAAITEEGGIGSSWINKKSLQLFSKNNVLDYSSTIDENWNLNQINWKNMIRDICDYAPNHPNEKILVYIEHHWYTDGSSGNWWTKEDWLKISKYPNVKIMSVRCYFWEAYNSDDNWSWDYIYNQSSQLSWFSNKSTTSVSIWENLKEWFDKWLWFHELEIYARLKYLPDSVTPLTENFEWKISWLAYEWEWDIFDNIV